MVNAPEGLNQFFLGRLDIYIYSERDFGKKSEPCHLHLNVLATERERAGVFWKNSAVIERAGVFRKNSEKIRTYVAICT